MAGMIALLVAAALVWLGLLYALSCLVLWVVYDVEPWGKKLFARLRGKRI